MNLSPTEALDYLSRAAREIAEVWAQAGTAWIPDDVNQNIASVVDLVQPAVPRVDHDYVLALVRKERNELVHGPLERAIRERAERERAAQEQAERERAERERAAQEQAERERAERERVEREARDRLERTTHELAEQMARATAEQAVQQKLAQERAIALEEERARVEEQRLRNRPNPAPEPQPFGVSHEGAEHLACAWMRHLGVLDARVTRLSRDGGVDVESDAFVCQVKNYQGSVSVMEVRALFGVAASVHKHALIFTSGSLTTDAAEFAERVGIAVLHYKAVDGSLHGLNNLAVRAVKTSIPEAYGLGS